jgi:hypothetical protein
MKAGSKELRELQRHLVGCHLEPDGKAKARVVDDATGRPIRLADGRPLTFPNSPSHGSVRQLRVRLRRHGLLEV